MSPPPCQLTWHVPSLKVIMALFPSHISCTCNRTSIGTLQDKEWQSGLSGPKRNVKLLAGDGTLFECILVYIFSQWFQGVSPMIYTLLLPNLSQLLWPQCNTARLQELPESCYLPPPEQPLLATYFNVSFMLQVEQAKQFTHQALLRAETTSGKYQTRVGYQTAELYQIEQGQMWGEINHWGLVRAGLQQLHWQTGLNLPSPSITWLQL